MTPKGESAHPRALAHREWALVGTLFLAHAHLPQPQVIQLDNCHVANHHKGHYSHENDSLPNNNEKEEVTGFQVCISAYQLTHALTTRKCPPTRYIASSCDCLQ